MNRTSFLESYKKIPLYVKENEEYEACFDNIAELLVMRGSENISHQCEIILNFSKEALIGFGTYCIRNSVNYNENFHSHIEPLGNCLSNQAMGFFLTPESAELIVGCKNFGNIEELGIKYNSSNKLKGKTKYNKLKVNLSIDLNFDNENFEYYNIGFMNIAELKVKRGKEDISKQCRVTLIASKNGLLGLGTELLRLSHNFSNEGKYFMAPEESSNGALGFFLTSNSSRIEVGCTAFENVFFYDKSFGEL